MCIKRDLRANQKETCVLNDASVVTLVHQVFKRAVHSLKEPYKETLHLYRKSPVSLSKDPYIYVKRALCLCQKSTISVSKEPYLYAKKALHIYHKSPI